MSREFLLRWHGQPWFSALILSGASVALGIFAARYDRFPSDGWLTDRVGLIGAWFEQPAETACALATPVAIFAGVAGAAFALARRRQGELAVLFGSLLIVRPLLSLARLPIERPRVSDPQDLLSFPSGHVMTAALPLGFWLVFGGALVSARTATLIRFIALAYLALLGVARVWLGDHRPSEVYGALVWSAAVIAWGVATRPHIARLVGRLYGRRPGEGEVES